MNYQVKKCAWCQAENAPSEIACLRCGRPLSAVKIESENEPLRSQSNGNEPPSRIENWEPPPPATMSVSVVDIKMPFESMVWFMVKWAIAAIPALLILLVIAAVFAAFISGAMHTH